MLSTIIKKYIFDRTDWTAEELQFQKNNPQLLEKELAELHRRFSAMPKDVRAVDSRLTLPERMLVKTADKNSSRQKIKGIIDIPVAAALALYGGYEHENIVAVAVFNGEAIDLAVLDVGMAFLRSWRNAGFPVEATRPECAGGCWKRFLEVLVSCT